MLTVMSAETNARDHAKAFYYWQSSIRQPEGTEEDAMPLRDLAELRKATEELIRQEVADMRYDGMSWAKIGEALGTSKQAAQRKYGSKA